METGTQRIELSIFVDAGRDLDTVSGRIAVAGEPPEPFYGWLELIDHIKRAAAGADAGTAVLE